MDILDFLLPQLLARFTVDGEHEQSALLWAET